MPAEIRQTAKIYRFPVKPRARPAERREEGKAATIHALQPGPALDCGAWYHEAAVQEAERAPKP
jgi:hypothetical protein